MCPAVPYILVRCNKTSDMTRRSSSSLPRWARCLLLLSKVKIRAGLSGRTSAWNVLSELVKGCVRFWRLLLGHRSRRETGGTCTCVALCELLKKGIAYLRSIPFQTLTSDVIYWLMQFKMNPVLIALLNAYILPDSRVRCLLQQHCVPVHGQYAGWINNVQEQRLQREWALCVCTGVGMNIPGIIKLVWFEISEWTPSDAPRRMFLKEPDRNEG
jgi:hypothetical protein